MAGSKPHAQCQCTDTGCPVHLGKPCAHVTRLRTVYRVDMEDHTGTDMCADCVNDCLESGLFTLKGGR